MMMTLLVIMPPSPWLPIDPSHPSIVDDDDDDACDSVFFDHCLGHMRLCVFIGLLGKIYSELFSRLIWAKHIAMRIMLPCEDIKEAPKKKNLSTYRKFIPIQFANFTNKCCTEFGSGCQFLF